MGPELIVRQRRALARVRTLAAAAQAGSDWSVTLAFHPDRLVDRVPVLAAIARDGLYRNQFETGTTNGGLTAHPEGDRWRWESLMFGGVYDDADPGGRPVYGALDLTSDPGGASPRFGSSFLRLRPEVLRRSTFCYPDSVFEPPTSACTTGSGRSSRRTVGTPRSIRWTTTSRCRCTAG